MVEKTQRKEDKFVHDFCIVAALTLTSDCHAFIITPEKFVPFNNYCMCEQWTL